MRVDRLRALQAAAAITAAACLLSAGAAQARAPRYTLYTYKVTMGVSGAANLDANNPDAAEDHAVIQEHFTASYHLDGRFPYVVFVTGKAPRGFLANKFDDTEAVVLNGTWNDAGTEWIDYPARVSGPFTCGGAVKKEVHGAGTELLYNKKGSKLNFRLYTLHSGLITTPDSCADTSGIDGGLQWPNGYAYETPFSLPTSDIGRKSFSKTISGPLASLNWHQYSSCFSNPRCNFTMAWQGVLRFTRTRVFKSPF